LRPSSWFQAAQKLWHTTNVRGATFEIKIDNERTIPFYVKSKTCIPKLLQQWKAREFIATSTGSALFLPVSDPPIVGADTDLSYQEL
jgi:hypothetical protein